MAPDPFQTAAQFAKKCGISRQRVIVLLNDNRIPGAFQVGGRWLIPVDAEISPSKSGKGPSLKKRQRP